VSSNSSFIIHYSGREDARGPVRNGASHRQSLIVIVIEVLVNPII
jgi:hypothetical protein